MAALSLVTPVLLWHSADVSTAPEPPPPTLSPQQQQLIADALNSRGVSPKCPRCAPGGMTLIDGLTSFSMQTTSVGIILGGPAVPASIMACNNCGYLEFHALGALGLMNHPAFQQDQA